MKISHSEAARRTRLFSRPPLDLVALVLMALYPLDDWPYWVGVGILAAHFVMLNGEFVAKRFHRSATTVANVGAVVSFVAIGSLLLVGPTFEIFAAISAFAIFRVEWILATVERQEAAFNE